MTCFHGHELSILVILACHRQNIFKDCVENRPSFVILNVNDLSLDFDAPF